MYLQYWHVSTDNSHIFVNLFACDYTKIGPEVKIFSTCAEDRFWGLGNTRSDPKCSVFHRLAKTNRVIERDTSQVCVLLRPTNHSRQIRVARTFFRRSLCL